MYNFLELKLHNLDRVNLPSIFSKAITSYEPITFFGWSVTVIPRIRDFPSLLSIVNSFDYIIFDGRGLYLIFKFFNYKLFPHFSLPDLVDVLLIFSNTNRLNVLLIGATTVNNSNAVSNLSLKYPNAKFVGVSGDLNSDFFLNFDNNLKEINPDVILIGMHSPFKEELALSIKLKKLSKVIIPCGGMIDVYSGFTRREPQLIKFIGFAWLWRVFLEPKRLFINVFFNVFRFLFCFLPIFLFSELRKKFLYFCKSFF